MNIASYLIRNGKAGGLGGGVLYCLDGQKGLSILQIPSVGLQQLKVGVREGVKVADWSVIGRYHWLKVYQPLLQR